MGHVGKQLFLVTAGVVPEQNAHTPAVFVVACSPSLLVVDRTLLFSRARVFPLAWLISPPLLLMLQVQIDRTACTLVHRLQ